MSASLRVWTPPPVQCVFPAVLRIGTLTLVLGFLLMLLHEGYEPSTCVGLISSAAVLAAQIVSGTGIPRRSEPPASQGRP